MGVRQDQGPEAGREEAGWRRKSIRLESLVVSRETWGTGSCSYAEPLSGVIELARAVLAAREEELEEVFSASGCNRSLRNATF